MMLEGVLLMTIVAAPLPTPDWVDLARYAGRWYEIARLPNRFEDHCAGDVAATYTLRPDGRFTVVNECRQGDGRTTRAEGVARLADEKGPASRLKVRFAPAALSFLPFVWGDYWIIDLAADYGYVAIGEPKREYLWILSRTPALEESVLAGIFDRVKKQGYDLTGLIRTVQTVGEEKHRGLK
jgi:apolipoprotein D and lipocalin family protein